ncbi:MAG: diguanylate cyclase, partial [Nitrospira sp.]|nr:diguanylate cyclase [Nitrospira sp.]
MSRHHLWIVSVVATIALLTILGLGWAMLTVQERLIQSAGHSLVQAATDASSKLEMMVLERYSDIQVLASAPITQEQNPVALTRYLNELLRAYPAYRWIGATDSGGTLIASAGPSIDSHNLSQRSWFKLARTLTAGTILDVQTHEESQGTLAIMIIAPVHGRDGRFLGAISAIVGVPRLLDILDDTMEVLKDIQWTEESHIEYQLLNEQGDLIADSTLRQEGTLNLHQLGLPSAMMVGTHLRGFIEEIHLRRNTSVITAYAQVAIAHANPTLHWGILIRVDRDSIFAPIRSFLWKLSILALATLLPLLVLAFGMVNALHTEWLMAKQESQRALDAETALTKRTEALHTLITAAQTLSAQQSLDGLLAHLLEIAHTRTGANYVALAIAKGTHQNEEERFIGMGSDTEAALVIRSLPIEGGARESLGRDEAVLSLNHLRRYWASHGYPASHAPLSSFLGVSILCHGQFFGRLSLANKLTADRQIINFSELDEQIVSTLAAQAGTAIQNLQLLQDSKEEARHDSLTGLLNHSAILNALTQELSRAERTGLPVAVLIADLDHFKRINDTYGHPIGDIVLQETAQRLRETARHYDHVGRAGGEEFMIIVPHCDLEALPECAERFRAAISDMPFDTASGPLTITVSIGATVWSPAH